MIKFNIGKNRQSRASHRLRAVLPVAALTAAGHQAAIVERGSIPNNDDVVIFTKDSLMVDFENALQSGARVGFDLCDNKWDEDGELYNKFCKNAHFITVNTEEMKQVVFEQTNRDSFVYADCFERKILQPKIELHQPLQLVWYGSSSSLRYLGIQDAIRQLDLSNLEYQITFVVNNAIGLRDKFQKRFSKNHAESFPLINTIWKEWTWEDQEASMLEADVVFIPMLAIDELTKTRLRTKSPNRLTDAIAQGKWVITSPIPSYVPLQDFSWQRDPIEGLHWFTNNLELAQQKILSGQEYIKLHHSPEVVAQQLLGIVKAINNG